MLRSVCALVLALLLCAPLFAAVTGQEMQQEMQEMKQEVKQEVKQEEPQDMLDQERFDQEMQQDILAQEKFDQELPQEMQDVQTQDLETQDVQTQDLETFSLAQLYRRKVQVAEWHTRRKQGLPSWVPSSYATTHSGVKVTLQGTSIKYLIHKGPKNSDSSFKTIITEARYMTSAWKLKQRKYYNGRVTVQDLMNAAGGTYTWWDENCHKAAEDMMNL
ncbi:hypothetical protein WMY93_030540 [Mugilogobius chulae]|uniref:Uncharacterized protein n=1 Tax=Mugilogobius chulae TaxID=88201 RepID=A0AAW0MHB5_9GOBI